MKKLMILACFLLCSALSFAQVSSTDLSKETLARFERVPEFAFIQEEAKKLGLDVYLFGGTASAFAHYIRWDLEREGGDDKYQPERFDYDFTNIYRGNQDLDIVVDGNEEDANKLRDILQAKYAHFVGDRVAWEVRLLRGQTGDKQPLLNDKDFLNQHTDSNSTGLLKLTANANEIVFRDLFDWDNPESNFLSDVANAKISYYFSKNHEETTRFKERKNPPILSAVRYIAKLAQYEVEKTEDDWKKIKRIIDKIDKNDIYNNSYVKQKLIEFGLKTLLNAPDVEYAWDLLDESGLREMLIGIDGNSTDEIGTTSWWLNKEPLRTFDVGEGEGRTAKDLKIGLVSHETRSFKAYDSITRSNKGKANVFISRSGTAGEGAAYGDGFYTKKGESGAVGTGITVRFEMNPDAREGTDFTVSGDFVVILNKAAIRLKQENMNMSLLDYFKLTTVGGISQNDKGLIAKMERKFIRQDLEDNETLEILEFVKSVPGNQDLSYTLDLWLRLEDSADYPDFIEEVLNKNRLTLSNSTLTSVLKQEHWAKHRESILSGVVERRNYGLLNHVRGVVFEEGFKDKDLKYFLFKKLVEIRYLVKDTFSALATESFWAEDLDLIELLINEFHFDKSILEQIIVELPPSKRLSEIVSMLIVKNNVNMSMLQNLLLQKEWAEFPELIEQLIDMNLEGLGTHFNTHIFSKPEWSNNYSLLKKLILSKQADAYQMITAVFSVEGWNYKPDLILEIIPRLEANPNRGESGLTFIAKLLLERPDWKKNPDVVIALLEGNNRQANQAIYELVKKEGWSEFPQIFKKMIGLFDFRSLSGLLLEDGWKKQSLLFDEVLLSPETKLDNSLAYMKSENFEVRPELLEKFINAKWVELQFIRQPFNSRVEGHSNLSILIESVLSNPGWSKSPQILDQLIPILDVSAEVALVKHVFTNLDWDPIRVEKMVNNFIEVGNVEVLSAIVESLLVLENWPNRDAVLTRVLSLNLDSVDISIAKTIINNKNPFSKSKTILVNIIKKDNRVVNKRIMTMISESEKWEKSIEWVNALLDRKVHAKGLGVILANLPLEDLKSRIQDYLDGGQADGAIVESVLVEKFSADHPEWLFTILERRHPQNLSFIDKNILTLSHWRKHKLLRSYLGGKDLNTINLRAKNLEEPFKEWILKNGKEEKPLKLSCSSIL